MNLLLALFVMLPQDYMNFLMEGKYDEAINYCDVMISQTNGGKAYEWRLEKADIYFDKIHDIDKASALYQKLIDDYPKAGGFWIFSKRRTYPDLGWLHLRLGLVLEMKEDYLNAAKAYETVATKFRKFPLDSFALSGVERCFKKNYQDYVATIDGYNITRLELDEALANARGRDEKAILDQIILGRLIYTNAVKNKIAETDFFKENIMLRRNTFLQDEVRSFDVINKATPSEAEMKRYYNKNKNNYKLRELVKGKEIVVNSDSLARYLLDSLKKDISSFDTLAKIYSTANSRNQGGNMGTVYRGTKSKPVDDVIFITALNRLTDVIPSDNLFGIYLITEHRPEQYRAFDDVKTSVDATVREEKTKAIEEKLSKNLRSDARILIYKDSLTTKKDTIDNTEDRIVAMINGRQIKWSDLQKRNETQPVFGRVDLAKSAETEKFLNTMIDEQLQIEWAERNKYFLHDGYFTQMKNEITNLMDRGLYVKIVIEGAKVDSQEITDYYKTHKNEFKVPEAVRCQEIVVNSKVLANELRKIILKNPEKFDSLAREHSIAPTKARGGDTGPIRKGMRPKKFEDVVFNLKIGALTKVFSTDGSSYTLVKLAEHTPEAYQSFDAVKQQIESKLVRDKQRMVVEDFLAKIKNEARIEIFLGKPEIGNPKENKEETEE